MGLFSSIGGFFATAAKAVATGGISLVAPKLIPSFIDKPLTQLVSLQNPSNFAQLKQTIGFAAAPFTGGTSALASRALLSGGGSPMAFNVGGLLGSIGGILGSTNTSGNPYIGGLGSALQLASSAIPVAQGRPPMSAPSVSVPAIAGSTALAVAGRGLTQEIFNAGAKVMNRLGIPFKASTASFTRALKRSLATIAALARRTPAGTMVGLLTGLGLTAMEAYVLTSWQAQRKKSRRMNPANSSALRRSVRRIKAFHRLCGEADVIKRRGGCKTKGRGMGQQFVRQG